MRRLSPIFLYPLLALSLLTACPGGEDQPLDNQSNQSNQSNQDNGDAGDVDTNSHSGDTDAETGNQEEPVDYPLATCDALDPSACAFPWPSSLYLAPDSDRATGYALRFGDESLPINNPGQRVRPDLFEHLDGYDLGTPIMVRFPNLDASPLPDEYAIADSLADDARIQLFRVDGTELSRLPYWAELDRREDDVDDKTLFIRPAVLLEPDTRYLVALQDLVDNNGDTIAPSEAFAALVAGDTDNDDVLRQRQPHFDELFELLEAQDLDRQDLVLAWDFHTASSEAIHDPLQAMRDDALASVDDQGIDWTVDEVIEFTDDEQEADNSDLDYDPYFGLEIRATIEVPHYLEPYPDLDDAWQLHRQDDGQITQNGTRQADILVRIPHRALAGDTVGIVLYGHGLLGNRWSLYAEHLGVMAQDFGYAMVAVDMIGMSSQDADVAEAAAGNVNHFKAMGDRLHQGMLEYILAAHTARHDLADLPALDEHNIAVDPQSLYYFGGSQGGIFGTTFMALSPDIQRGYLAVPGNNYATLLQRSVNFDDFNQLMGLTYGDSANLNINLALLNLMWSPTDPVSYLRHVVDAPFGDRDPRQVLMAQARGDWQVATITNEISARSNIGLPVLAPYDEDRQPFDLDQATYPHDGSGIINFNFGNPWPAPGNLPPDDDLGDPHGWLSTVYEHGEQIDHFFRNGEIIDICDGAPCRMPAP